MHRRLEVGHVFFGVQIAQAVLLPPVARCKRRGVIEEGGTYQTNQTNTPKTISPTNPPNAPPTIGPSGISELPLLSPLLPPVALAPLLVKKLVEVYVTYVVAPSGRVEADWEVITVALVPGEVGAIVVVVVVELPVLPPAPAPAPAALLPPTATPVLARKQPNDSVPARPRRRRDGRF